MATTVKWSQSALLGRFEGRLVCCIVQPQHERSLEMGVQTESCCEVKQWKEGKTLPQFYVSEGCRANINPVVHYLLGMGPHFGNFKFDFDILKVRT